MPAMPTRRGFLAGALAGAGVPALAGARAEAAPSVQAKQRIVMRGRAIAVAPKGNRVVVAHDRRRTIGIVTAGRKGASVVDVGGQPVEVAVSPDGRTAAVTTAFWDDPGLALVDLASGRLRDRVKVGPAPFGVAFTRDGKHVVVSGGEQEGTVHVVETRRFSVVEQAPIGLVPRGIALPRAGSRAWIALNGDDRVVRVDLRTGRVRRTVKTPALPDRVAASPDGKRLLVSHGGPDSAHVSEIVIATGKVRRHLVGPQPSGVAWTPEGHRLVTLGGANRIVRIGAARRRAVRPVGAAPRGLAVAGKRAWTVSALTGNVTKVRT
jgi:DNA-binding beta-propeller fold protein YncE